MSLLRTTRGGKPVTFELSNGGALVGTAPGCQIVVADPAAAPKHCKIVRTPQGFVVTDLSGGTVVNGTKVKEHVLRDGDILQVGAEKFVFAEKKAAPAPAAPSKASGAPAPAPAPANGGRRPLPSRPARGPATGIAAHRKLIAKPGSVARVHHDHHLFALPSTSKGRAIALSVGVGLVLLGGALFMISANTVNSEDVKKKAEEAVQRFEKMPEADFRERFKAVEEILGNPDFQKYAKKEIHPAAREREGLKKRVDLEDRAGKVLKPFFGSYKALEDGPPEEFNKQADSMWEIVKVHYDDFKTTTYGPRLEGIRAKIKEFLEKRGLSTWSDEILKLSPEVTRQIKEKNFSMGLTLVDNFGKQYGEKDSNQLKSQLQDLRDRLRVEAKKYIEDLKISAEGKATKEEKRQLLEAARPFIKGFPDVEKFLDRSQNELK